MDFLNSQKCVILERSHSLKISIQCDEYMPCTPMKDGVSSADVDLHDAILAGKINSIKKIVSSEDCSINGEELVIEPPIIICLYAEHKIYDKDGLCSEILNLLIQAGADTNVREKTRRAKTSTMIAAKKGLLQCLKVLTENGADLSAECRYDQTALMYAFEKDHLHCAKYLIENMSPSKINSFNYENCPLVILCLETKHTEGQNEESLRCDILRLLIQAGVDINARKIRDGRTAAMIAAKNGLLQCLKVLTKTGADLGTKCKRGRTAIMYALSNIQFHCAKYLIENMSPSAINSVNYKNDPLVILCLEAKHTEGQNKESFRCDILRLLIEAGADLNARNIQDGTTAAMVAAGKGLLQCLEILIENGADLSAECKDHRTALIYALANNQLYCTKCLIDHMSFSEVAKVHGDYDPIVILCLEAKHNDNQNEDRLLCEILRLLVEAGADINARKIHNRKTAAMIAAGKGLLQCLEVLKENGADLSAECAHGRTALMYALAHSHLCCIKYRLRHTSFSEIVTVHGTNEPLVTSCLKPESTESHDEDISCCEILKLIIKAGADINASEKYSGRTAAMIAANQDYLSCLKTLHKSGADLNAQCVDCRTALMYAVSEDHVECAQYLLENMSRRNINLKDFDGKTALILAAQNGSDNCVRLLMNAGAEIDTKDNEGNTALMKALYGFFSGVVNPLLDHGATFAFDNAKCYRFLTRDCKYLPLSKLNLFQPEGGLIWSWMSCRLLHLAIYCGRSARSLIKTLILKGCAPIDAQASEFLSQRGCFDLPGSSLIGYRMISPLALSLILGQCDIAQYFIANRFFTMFDIQQYCWYSEFCECNDLHINNYLDNEGYSIYDLKIYQRWRLKNIINHFCSAPQSLFTLSLVTVSSALTQHLSAERFVFKALILSYREKVERLPLPPALKRALTFQTPNSDICCDTWGNLPASKSNALSACRCTNCKGGENKTVLRDF